MGCTISTKKRITTKFEEWEDQFQFGKYSITEIKGAFFQASQSDVVNRFQVQKALRALGIYHDIDQKSNFQKFMETFESFEEEDVLFYDLKSFLAVIFILSNSTQEQKATALFDLFDMDCTNLLSKFEAENGLSEIINNVYNYTSKVEEQSIDVLELRNSLVSKKKDELLVKIVNQLYEGTDNLNKKSFVSMLIGFAREDKYVDFTDTQSIRESFMKFFYDKEEDNEGVQEMAKNFRKSAQKKNTFAPDADRTNDTSSVGGEISSPTNFDFTRRAHTHIFRETY